MRRSAFLGLCAVSLGTVAALLHAPAWGRGVCGPDDDELPDNAVAFVGEAAETSADPATGHLLSPATFRVDRWIEGDGPDQVQVETAVTVEDGLVRATSTGITPRAGERWRIRGVLGRDDVVSTTVCVGSERLSTPTAPDEAEEVASGASDEPSDPGDDRALSLAVAAAGASALAVALTRQPSRPVTPAAPGPETTAKRASRPLRARRTTSSASPGSSKSTK